jgi:hypothetical protein
MSWPYYYANASGFSEANPPRSEREQGLALVGLNCSGGMSETMCSSLQGFVDGHMGAHYGGPSGSAAPCLHTAHHTAWLRRPPCHPNPSICTCGFCPEGLQGYTRGQPGGLGLPLRMPGCRPLPVLDNTRAAGLGPDKPVKWKDIPRVAPRWDLVLDKPPSWREMHEKSRPYVRHAPDCPRLRNPNRQFWCSCGAGERRKSPQTDDRIKRQRLG